jgi:biotin carboxyl carrier protein
MEYKIKIGDRIYPVETSALDEEGRCRMSIEGNAYEVRARAVAPHQLHLRVDGMAVNLFMARSDQGTWVWVDGRARLVQDADTEPRRRTTVHGETPREVTPPTPAAVVRVLTAVGDRVERGQGLVVVSAMKMEMTLKAPYSGTVRAVNTEVGAQVSPGEVLVEIEPDTEGETNE